MVAANQVETKSNRRSSVIAVANDKLKEDWEL
jgi:hypothetical protein